MNNVLKTLVLTGVVYGGAAIAASSEDHETSYWLDDPQTAEEMGIMQGYPVPVDRMVTWENFDRGPNSRWSFQHMTAISPHARLDKVDDAMPLPAGKSSFDINSLTFTAADGSVHSVGEFLHKSYTDSFLVVKDGALISEQYFNGMKASTPHLVMSVTKTYTAMVAGILVEQGKLETSRKVVDYLPELKGTGIEDSTVQQVLDMSSAVKYSEDYSDPRADTFVEACSFGWGNPAGCDFGKSTFEEYVQTLKEKSQKDGEKFHYRSVLTNVVAMLVERTSGKRLVELLDTEIWQKLGAEHDGYISVDRVGFSFAGGGLSATARDVAKFGVMLLQDGRFNGQQVIPVSWLEDTRYADDQTKRAFAVGEYAEVMPGWHYRNQTWVKDSENGVMLALGVHGQIIYINKPANVVIVKQSSQPTAVNLTMYLDTFAAMDALADALKANSIAARH